MIKKALCAILVLSMLLSSIAVTGLAAGAASGGGTGGVGGSSSVNTDVTFDIQLTYEKQYKASALKYYDNVVKIDVYLKGLNEGDQINVIDPLKLTFDSTKATGKMINGKNNTAITTPVSVVAGTDNPYTLGNIDDFNTAGDGYVTFGITALSTTDTDTDTDIYIVGDGTDKHLLTAYIQLSDADIYGAGLTGELDPTKTDCLDITVDTSAFKVSNMTNSVVIKEYTYAFTSKNLTLDLREEMTGVAASGKTVTYDGYTHNIEVTGAPSGSTITYKCENAAFTGTKDAGEYEVTATVECPGYKPLTLEPETLIINPKELTAGVVVADSRAYNGTNIVDVTVTLNGKVGTDDVAIANAPTTGTMEDKHVGTGKEVTIGELTLGGNDAANYTLTQPAKPTINITKANVEFKGISDSIKINEELPTGTLYETIGTIFSGDTVSGNFKVDINGSLEATTYDIINDDVTVDDGNNGDNYNVTYTNGELVVVDLGQHPDPIASELSLTYGEAKEFALTLVDVEADAVTVEPINEEVVTVSYDAAAKKITVTPVKAGNTEITVTVPETDACEEKVFTANVTVAKKALAYTVTAEEKEYNADYDFVATAVLDGVVNDDVVEVECIGASIPEKNVGEYVGKVQLRLTGTDSANYVFDVAEGDDSAEVIVDNIAVIVVPKEIIATVEAVNRTYDGTLDFEILVSLDGVLAVDEEFVTATATGELTSKNAGAYDADVTVSLSGDASVNYVLAEEVLNTSVEIYKKDITASVVAEDKIYDGKVDINATATLAGVLSGDTVINSVVADVYSKNVGTYTNGHAIISLAGADADNYELAISEFNDVEVTISPKELTVTGLAATNRVTDETTVVALTGGALDGIVEGDNVYATMPTEGTIADSLAGNNKVVTIAEITLVGDDADNYTLVQPTGITVNIYAPVATPTYRPSYSTGGGSSSSTVTPDKTDENKEDNKEEAKDENKEEDKEEVKEETTTDYTKATATVTLKEKASEIRFISTDEEGKFNPDVKATRNEVVNALNEILNITDATGDCDLNDIENSENAKIVELFTKANIIAGYDDGTFRGNDSITRAEFVKILTVALGVEVKEFENDKVSDVADHWSKNFVNSFVELGYILGYPDGTFRPDESISRAEVVIIVNRVIGKDVKNADNTDVTISDMDDSHWAYEYIMASVK